MSQLILVAHNLRSAHNVGSLLRTADGLGIEKVILSGYTPYPKAPKDKRLPHIATKVHNQIAKTALGAELSTKWEHTDNIHKIIEVLKADNWTIAALEQTKQSIALPSYRAPDKLVLIVGREVEGLEPQILKLTDVVLEIPMRGRKESFNVASAAAMALYQLVFAPSQKQV